MTTTAQVSTTNSSWTDIPTTGTTTTYNGTYFNGITYYNGFNYLDNQTNWNYYHKYPNTLPLTDQSQWTYFNTITTAPFFSKAKLDLIVKLQKLITKVQEKEDDYTEWLEEEIGSMLMVLTEL